MARHTAPNRKIVDDGFPVRIKIRVPPHGLGKRLDDALIWLGKEMPNRHAYQSVRALHMQAVGFYFRTVEDAQTFLQAFPDFDLADGTGGPY